MAYKEKTCPRCNTKHTKRGEYCSRSCGNVREWNKEQRQAVSDGLKQWHAESDTAAVAAHNFISQGRNKIADPVAPPVRAPLSDNQFIMDGDLWEEC
jgi:hypothetical protein